MTPLEELNAEAWRTGKPFIQYEGWRMRAMSPEAFRQQRILIDHVWRRIFLPEDDESLCIGEMK